MQIHIIEKSIFFVDPILYDCNCNTIYNKYCSGLINIFVLHPSVLPADQFFSFTHNSYENFEKIKSIPIRYFHFLSLVIILLS